MSDFVPARPHGPLQEVLPGIWFVTGTVRMAPLVTFSRAMTIVREDDRLVLINSVRLDDEGLAALDELGTVTDVIRLAGFHGMDDPFYADRYDAKVWVLPRTRYLRGFAPDKGAEPYFRAHVEVEADTELPLRGASMISLGTKPPEGLLRLDREGGVLIAGDCLQNWAEPDRYFSLVGRVMMRMMGFIRPHNLGPGWLKATKPRPEQVRAILELSFEHVLPSHGTPVIGGAKDAYRPVIEAYDG
ncbi:MAG: hypothetical protein KC501_36125 [Myxococcales bacterium]|nr:hypothetical protein [Myxococcales bacterium]